MEEKALTLTPYWLAGIFGCAVLAFGPAADSIASDTPYDEDDAENEVEDDGPAAALSPSDPDLLYNPATGNVTLFTDGIFFDSYLIKTDDEANFNGPAASFAFQGFFAGGTTDLASDQIFENNPTGAFLAITNGGETTFDLGDILPANLDAAQLGAVLETTNWSEATNASGTFDVIIVPEPASVTLFAATGLLALRRRRLA